MEGAAFAFATPLYDSLSLSASRANTPSGNQETYFYFFLLPCVQFQMVVGGEEEEAEEENEVDGWVMEESGREGG